MICHKCFSRVDADSLFCDSCGSRLIEIDDYKKGDLEAFKAGDFWGYRDVESKKVVIPPKYNSAEKHENGLAIVEQNSKYGVIDRTGVQLTKLKYNCISGFVRGYAKVKEGKLWSFINERGKQIAPTIYEEVCDFDDCDIAVVRWDKKFLLLNTDGQEITKQGYQSIHYFKNGLYLFRNEGKAGLLDISGNVIVESIYDRIEKVNQELSILWSGNATGYVNNLGKIVVTCNTDKKILKGDNLIIVKSKDGIRGYDIYGTDISNDSDIFKKYLKIKKGRILISIVAVILFFMSALIIYDSESNQVGIVKYTTILILGEDTYDWRFAKNNATLYKLKPVYIYLKKHPRGKHAAEAKAYIESGEWRQVLDKGTVSEIKSFLAKYPQSRKKHQAEEILLWSRGQEHDSLELYYEYIDKYPGGSFFNIAMAKIDEKQWQRAQKKNTKDSYEYYLKVLDSGKHNYEALESIFWIKSYSAGSKADLHAYLKKYPNGNHVKNVLVRLIQMCKCESCKGKGVCPQCAGTGIYGKERKLVYDICPNSRKLFHGGNCKICGGDGKINEKYTYVDTICDKCKGQKICVECSGTGNIQDSWLNEWHANYVNCDYCDRTGYIKTKKRVPANVCSCCRGKGKMYESQRRYGIDHKGYGAIVTCNCCSGVGIYREAYTIDDLAPCPKCNIILTHAYQ